MLNFGMGSFEIFDDLRSMLDDAYGITNRLVSGSCAIRYEWLPSLMDPAREWTWCARNITLNALDPLDI